MTELTTTQRTVLTAAAARPGQQILPLPEHIKGGAAKKVTTALLARGLIRDDGGGATLVATDAGLRAIGLELASATPHADGTANQDEPRTDTEPSASDPAAQKASPKIRPGTKQATLIAMLDAPEGASIAEIAESTGWQHHTVRGAIAGALKKRLGLDVTSEKDERRGRVYRLAR